MKAQIRKIGRTMAGWPVIGRLVRIVVAVIRLPEFRAEYIERLQALVQSLSEINRQLIDLNHRQHVLETEKLPALVHSISEINRQLTDLNHRQHVLETEKLPALLYDSDNLVKSVPVALRKITRDLVGVQAKLEGLSNIIEEAGLSHVEVIDRPGRKSL
jgi:hypothetical protein